MKSPNGTKFAKAKKDSTLFTTKPTQGKTGAGIFVIFIGRKLDFPYVCMVIAEAWN